MSLDFISLGFIAPARKRVALTFADVPGLDSSNNDFMDSDFDSVGVTLLIMGVCGVEEDALVESELDDEELRSGLWKVGVLGLEFVIVSSSKIHEYPSLAHCCIVR